MWKKKWFRSLTPAEKAAWFYIKDECDNVGVCVPDFELAEFQIGASVDWENLPGKTNGNIEVLPNGKWFLVDFCAFQYGTLKSDPKNKPHQSYLKLLAYHGLSDRVSIDYEKPTHSLKDKDKDTDKETDTEKDGLKYTDGFARFWKSYPRPDKKAESFKVWKRDKLESRTEEIISKLEAFKTCKDWKKENGRFIPHGSTWLNQKRYDDDLQRISASRFEETI